MEHLVRLFFALGRFTILAIALGMAAIWWKAEQPDIPKGQGKFVHRTRTGHCEYMFQNGETGVIDGHSACPPTLEP